MRAFIYIILCSLNVVLGCTSGRPFQEFILGSPADKPLPEREVGTPDRAPLLSTHNVKVVYNDGSTMTEVIIPVLSSGQQIVIDHKDRPSRMSLTAVPPAPAQADADLEQSYVRQGLRLSEDAQPVSMTKSHEIIRRLAKEGNYGLALEYVEVVLKRYPQHAQSLRTKGSLLLRMGEKEAALRAYEAAQEVEPDSRVEREILNIEKGLR